MGPTTVAVPFEGSTRISTLLLEALLPPAVVDDTPYIVPFATATRSPALDRLLPKLPRELTPPFDGLICFTSPAVSAASRSPRAMNVMPLFAPPDSGATWVA